MKFRVGVVLLILALSAYAQQPSVQDTLTWIGSHFESVRYATAFGSSTEQVVVSTQMDFHGCSVTVRESSRSSPPEPFDGTVTSGPFELGTLRPETIKIDPQPQMHRYIMWISAVNTFPVSMPDIHGNMISEPHNFLSIPFATEDMASRQAKAWRDAIIACGGRAVPDNLY